MEYPCANCGRTLAARDDLVGKHVVCVYCERMNVVPEPPPVLLRDVSLADVLDGLRCPRCGYALRGLVENRCPECGRRFDPVSLLRTGWGQRPKGYFVAYPLLTAAILIYLLLACAGFWF